MMDKKEWVCLIIAVVVVAGTIGVFAWHETNKMRGMNDKTILGLKFCDSGKMVKYEDLYGTGRAEFHADFIIWPDMKKMLLDVPGVNRIVEYGIESQYEVAIDVAGHFFNKGDVYDGVAQHLCYMQKIESESRAAGHSVRIR